MDKIAIVAQTTHMAKHMSKSTNHTSVDRKLNGASNGLGEEARSRDLKSMAAIYRSREETSRKEHAFCTLLERRQK